MMCAGGYTCAAPPDHLLIWWIAGERRVELICAGHAIVTRRAVRSGNAAAHGHTPVTVSGPYRTTDTLAKMAGYHRRNR